MVEIYEGLVYLSLMSAIVAAYFSVKSWLGWKNKDFTTIKARVFLDKSFLDQNFKLTISVIFIIIVLACVHIIMEYVELAEKVSSDFYYFYYMYYGVFLIAMLSLATIAYKWSKLLCKNK
jgi:hypothetical protein